MKMSGKDKWEDYFDLRSNKFMGLTQYFIYWRGTKDCPHEGMFYHFKDAEKWIELNFKRLVDERFEKDVLS